MKKALTITIAFITFISCGHKPQKLQVIIQAEKDTVLKNDKYKAIVYLKNFDDYIMQGTKPFFNIHDVLKEKVDTLYVQFTSTGEEIPGAVIKKSFNGNVTIKLKSGKDTLIKFAKNYYIVISPKRSFVKVVNNKQEGLRTDWYDDQKQFIERKSSWVNGLKEGYDTTYHRPPAKNKIFEITYWLNNKREGKYFRYYENGILNEFSYYKNNELVDSTKQLFYNSDSTLVIIEPIK